MPAKSVSQKRLMDAAAHNPAFAKKVGVPAEVANEYSTASKGMSFKEGEMATKGKMMPFMGKESKAEEAMEKKKFPSKRGYAAMEAKKEGEKMPKFARGGGVETKGKTKGKMVAMARGGSCK